MISSLLIKNLLIVDALEINFEKGFNALTGETGAGKSILIDCIGFALGYTGKRGAVRKNNQKESEVIVSFELRAGNLASKVLSESGFNIQDEVIIRRSISIDGKKRSFINDKPCTVDLIKTIANFLIEFQGQNEERTLTSPSNHINLLDDFAHCLKHRQNISKIWSELRNNEAELEKLHEKSTDIDNRKEFLLEAINQIEKFDPYIGEENNLIERRKNIKNHSKILEHLQNAYSLISAESSETMLVKASKELSAAEASLPNQLSEHIESVDSILDSISGVSSDLKDKVESFKEQIEDSEGLDDRFFEIRAMAKKYGTDCNGLVNLPEKFKIELESISSKHLDKENLIKDIRDLKQKYRSMSEKLSQLRNEASSRLDKSVMEQLPGLRLGNAIFKTVISKDTQGRYGQDLVTFRASTDKGVTFGALEKVTSGGELSRFLLALKVSLVQDTKGTVLLFDEIDRGVGGATADAIGRKLLGLSSFGQVITVTHSPQVAALASSHYQIIKTLNQVGEVVITITELEDKDRVLELARMISGKIITDEAKAAAMSLIENGTIHKD